MARLSLYKLSDVLQMPIHYDGNGGVSGSAKALYKALDQFTLQLQLSARAIFFSEQVGVVAHVVGELYIMVAHNPEKNGISAFLLDGRLLPEEIDALITKDMNLRQAVAATREAIVGSFVLQGGQWKILDLPKSTQDADDLVKLEGGRTGEGHRSGDPKVSSSPSSSQGS